MPRRTKPAPPAPPPDHTLFEFAREYFAELGATVAQNAPADKSRLDVLLPEDLTAHFGRQRLALSFHSTEPESERELVAHGSRVFDQMMALLDRQSAFTVLRAPVRHRGGEALLTAVRPVNSSVGRLRMQEQSRFLFGLTWRLTYRADDKRQEIYTVWLDEEGERIAQTGEQSAAADALDLAQMMQDAEPIAPEHNADGEVLPPKLPPMTQLVRLAERARNFAVYHADVRCVTHEAEILPRLYKVLNRLTTYYQQQIDEVRDSSDPDGTRRRALEADLQRKLAEEVENHRLRVQVELIGYVALETPSTVAEMALSNGRHEVTIRVRQDRYSGVIERPALLCVRHPDGRRGARSQWPHYVRCVRPHLLGVQRVDLRDVRRRIVPGLRRRELCRLRPHLLGVRGARLCRAHQRLPHVWRRRLPWLPGDVRCLRRAPVPQPPARRLCRGAGRCCRADLSALCGALPRLPAVQRAYRRLRCQRPAFLRELPGDLPRLRAYGRPRLLPSQPGRRRTLLHRLRGRVPSLPQRRHEPAGL